MAITKPTSGSAFGAHFLSDFADCPTKWYWRNLALWPGVYLSVGPDGPISRTVAIDSRDTGSPGSIDRDTDSPPPISPEIPIGIAPAGFAPALDTGSRVHAGVAAFYQWGCRDGGDTGERNLEAMLEAARLDPPINPNEPMSEGLVESLALTDRLLTRYYECYKDDPQVRVAFDPSGYPLIEREFWLDLGYGGYQFTCRADLVYWQGGPSGYLRFMEHKTASARDLPKWLKRAEIDTQFTGQFLMGVSHFPEARFDGVTLNAIVKDRGKKSDLPDLMRKTFSRTPAHLEKFRLDAVRRLKRIDESVEEWRDLIGKGMEPDDAAKIVFDGSPSGYECVGMGMACPYLTLCSNRERISSLLLDSFQPRSYKYRWENPFRLSRKIDEP